MSSKVATMREAVGGLVRDGDTVAIEGFTHLICFAAGHEIIRQRKRDLTLARMTPDPYFFLVIFHNVSLKSQNRRDMPVLLQVLKLITARCQQTFGIFLSPGRVQRAGRFKCLEQ